MTYDYYELERDARLLWDSFAELTRVYIGRSVMGREIYCFKTGRGDRSVFLNGAHHGLEYLTSAFLVKFTGEFMQRARSRAPMYGVYPHKLSESVVIYTAPMINPDGVDIAANGLDITNPYHRRIISMTGIHSFSRVWQANARGVDLNHNYDADWRQGPAGPAPSVYGGQTPESEPEVKAVTEFVRGANPDLMIAFHSQGREIYYDFGGMIPKGAYDIGVSMAAASGYTLARPEGSAAYGGCKDWFISEFGAPGFTVEIGAGKNPLPLEVMDSVYEDNAKLILAAVSALL